MKSIDYYYYYLLGNEITDDCIKTLCNNIQYVTKLETLDLQINNITDEGAKLLVEYLPKCPELRYLNLYGNNIRKDEEIEILIKQNHPNKQLEVSFDAY